MRQRIPRIVQAMEGRWRRRAVDPLGRRALRGPVRPALAPLVVVVSVLAFLAAIMVSATASGAQVQAAMAELRVSGSVDQGPPGGGVTTASEMRYTITIENRGPDPVPVDGISLVIFVDRSDSTEMATIEVSRFASGAFKNTPGGSCGVGRQHVLRCTNRQVLDAGRTITLQIAHRHPVALAGQLSFFAEVSAGNGGFVDADASNNAFRGPVYVFRDPPATTTTTTASTTTSTSAPSTSSTDPLSSTTASSSSSTSSSTTSSSTTTTAPTTAAPPTTTAPTTTTTIATTTTAEVTTSLELMVGSDASLIPPSSNVGSVLESTGSAGLGDEDLAVSLGPQAEEGGPPYLLIGGLLAVLILLAGVGLAAYTYYYDRDPPLVDIRHYR